MQNPVTGPDAFESYQTANPVWQALDTAFQQYVLTNSSITPTTVYYYRSAACHSEACAGKGAVACAPR